MRSLPICCIAALAVLPAAEGLAAQCEFFDVAADELVDGPCSVDYEGDAEIITLGDKRAVFVVSGRQGQWAVGTLDGMPAMRYEKNRATFSYATGDLTRFIDRSDE